MTVATKASGNKDFDYPTVDLANYNLGFGKAKVIGDDENPSNEGKAIVPEGTVKEESGNNKPAEEKPAANPQKPAEETPQPQATSEPQTKPQASAPVPAAKPVSTNKIAPIPMAVPESLR